MTVEEMARLIETTDTDYTVPRSNRQRDALATMAAFTEEKDWLISGAEHDVIFFGADVEKFAEVSTKESVVALAKLGVMYDEDNDCFSMFV